MKVYLLKNEKNISRLLGDLEIYNRLNKREIEIASDEKNNAKWLLKELNFRTAVVENLRILFDSARDNMMDSWNDFNSDYVSKKISVFGVVEHSFYSEYDYEKAVRIYSVTEAILNDLGIKYTSTMERIKLVGINNSMGLSVSQKIEIPMDMASELAIKNVSHSMKRVISPIYRRR